MKKVLSLLMVLALTTTMFVGCGEGESKKEKKADAVKVIDINLTEEEYAFGVDKDDKELLDKVNDFVKQIKKDGTLDKICDNYFGNGEPVAVKSAKLDKNKDQLVVATNAAFEPFEYTKGEDYYGIDMEVAKALADSLGKELVIMNMDFDAVCLSVGQHKCDIGMAGLTVKPEREEYVTFSESYYSASQKIIVPGNNTEFDDCKEAKDVEAILDKKEKSVKIGVQNGTTGQFYVSGDKDWGFDGFKTTCTGYKNGSLAVQDMVNGNIQYVIIDSAPAKCITDAINKVQ